MPAPLLLPLLSLGAGLGSSLFNTISQRKTSRQNTERTITANREMAEYAYRKDLEMWERQNMYNSPEAQMERLKAAGLNPNLVYGQGAVANNSGPAPKFNPPTAEFRNTPLQLPQMLGIYQDFALRQAQIDNVKAQTKATQEKTISESFRRALLDLQGKRKEFELDVLAPHQADVIQSKAQQERTKVNLDLEKLKSFQSFNEIEKRLNIQKMGVDVQKRQAEVLFQKHRNEFIKMGITTSDHIILRMLVRMMNEAGFQP